MTYKWRKYLLKQKAKEAHERELTTDEAVYKNMIDLLSGNVNLDEIDITPDNNNHETYMTRFKRFHENIERLEPKLIDFISSIFSIEPEEDNIKTRIVFSKFDISNKELIELAYEILSSLNDKYVLNTFKDLIENKEHYLNITEFSSIFSGATQELCGLTMPSYMEKKSYITIQRNHTIQDVKSLVHEVLHAVYYNKYKPRLNVLYYFDELEGVFGNRLTGDYLLLHGMEKQGNEITVNELYEKLYESYLLFINKCLFDTAKDHRFRLRYATEMFRNKSSYKSRISPSTLNHACTINCYIMVTEILDYLACLELATKYEKPKDQYHKVIELKKRDSYDYVHYQMPQEYSFFKDNVRTLKRLKKYSESQFKEIKR